jgi:hypothetical protein
VRFDSNFAVGTEYIYRFYGIAVDILDELGDRPVKYGTLIGTERIAIRLRKGSNSGCSFCLLLFTIKFSYGLRREEVESTNRLYAESNRTGTPFWRANS